MCVYVYVHMCMCIVCVSNSVYEHAYTRVINTMHMFHKCSGCTQTYTRIINIRMKNTREFRYASSSHKSMYNTRYIYMCVYIYIYIHTHSKPSTKFQDALIIFSITVIETHTRIWAPASCMRHDTRAKRQRLNPFPNGVERLT